MHKHQLEYAAAQCWFTRSTWAELLEGKLFFIDRNLLASSNRMCECVEVGIHDIPVLFFCFSFFLTCNSSGIWPLDTLSFPAFLCKEVKPEELIADLGNCLAWFFFLLLLFFSFSVFLGENSCATIRTGESIHKGNFWPAFNTLCFPSRSVLC